MDRRKLLMVLLVIVVFGSVLAITLPVFGFLIVSRVVLAIGAGGIGGLAAGGTSMRVVSWVAVASVVIAVILGTVSFSRRKKQEVHL